MKKVLRSPDNSEFRNAGIMINDHFYFSVFIAKRAVIAISVLFLSMFYVFFSGENKINYSALVKTEKIFFENKNNKLVAVFPLPASNAVFEKLP